MRFYNIIENKRDKKEHTVAELSYTMEAIISGEATDYQISAWLMAVYLNGLTTAETATLTKLMADSGEKLDFSNCPYKKADKHSSGGIGDKTTPIVAAIVAANGVVMPKMSGRGLGYTGGTLDKFSAIPGWRYDLSRDELSNVLKEAGFFIAGQSADLAPVDKKLYALRDVTATVESIPLIASSIMSKKLAIGSDAIVLDVKYGSGALVSDADEAVMLAKTMVDIGTSLGRNVVALVTDMNSPLGNNIGNALEIVEVVEVLKGKQGRLTELSLLLSAHVLSLTTGHEFERCMDLSKQALASGEALKRFTAMVGAQGGDTSFIDDYSKLPTCEHMTEIIAEQDGYVTYTSSKTIGEASVILGAGRRKAEDSIDYGAGIVLHKTAGEYAKKGELLAILYTGNTDSLADATEMFLQGVELTEVNSSTPLVYATVTADGVVYENS